MSSGEDPLGRWEQAATGWGRRADDVRTLGMPVSAWMIDRLSLHPGQRVLELAAGPGDTGFLAAELIQPGGTLVCSDGAEAMLGIARTRATQLGIDNVEFARLELEWIDLPTASVDAVLCRWGLMLSQDPAAALHEMRRVLRPGGRIALAVWDTAEHNPWATIPTRALVTHGYAEPPDPGGPGMFALADRKRLASMIEDAGLVEVEVEPVDVARTHPSVDDYVEQTLDLSAMFAEAFGALDAAGRSAVMGEIGSLARPFAGDDGKLRFPGRALGAAASS